MTHNKSYLIYWVSRFISYIADNLLKKNTKKGLTKKVNNI